MLDKNDRKFIKDEVEEGLGQVLSAMDTGFKAVDKRFDKVEGRLTSVEEGLQDVKTELSEVKRRLTDLEADAPSGSRCLKNEKRISSLERAVLST